MTPDSHQGVEPDPSVAGGVRSTGADFLGTGQKVLVRPCLLKISPEVLSSFQNEVGTVERGSRQCIPLDPPYQRQRP